MLPVSSSSTESYVIFSFRWSVTLLSYYRSRYAHEYILRLKCILLRNQRSFGPSYIYTHPEVLSIRPHSGRTDEDEQHLHTAPPRINPTNQPTPFVTTVIILVFYVLIGSLLYFKKNLIKFWIFAYSNYF